MAEKNAKSEMHFGAYGPFVIGRLGQTVNSNDIDEFWRKVDRKEPGLSKGIGIYLAAIQVGTNKSLRPVYVGKTDSGFKKRLTCRHHLFKLFEDARIKGQYGRSGLRRLRIFFLARMKSEEGPDFLHARYRKPGRGAADEIRERLVELNSIAQLEFLLIGRCVKAGFYLFNSQHRAFHTSLRVAGLYGKTDAGNVKAKEKLSKIFQGK